MTTSSVPIGRTRSGPGDALRAGLVVGVLDGLAAVIFAWLIARRTPVQVFQGIARSLLGRDGAVGPGTAALGLVMHFAVAMTWAAVYAAIYRRSARLRRLTLTAPGALLTALVYGPLVWLTMRFGVLPLTRVPPGPLVWRSFLWMTAIHVACVGLPIALLVRDRQAD